MNHSSPLTSPRTSEGYSSPFGVAAETSHDPQTLQADPQPATTSSHSSLGSEQQAQPSAICATEALKSIESRAGTPFPLKSYRFERFQVRSQTSDPIDPSNRMQSVLEHIQDTYICPITGCIMENPYMAITRPLEQDLKNPKFEPIYYTYEKLALDTLITNAAKITDYRDVQTPHAPKDPITRRKIIQIVPNRALKKSIEAYNQAISDAAHPKVTIPMLEAEQSQLAGQYGILAQTYQQLGHPEAAEQNYLKALEYTDAPEASEAYVQFLKKQHAAAQERKPVEETMRQVFISLAQRYEATDNLKSAKRWYQEALKYDTANIDIITALIQLVYNLQKPKGTAKYIKQLIVICTTQSVSTEQIDRYTMLYHKTHDRQILGELLRIYRYGPEKFRSIDAQISLMQADLKQNPDDLAAYGSYMRYLEAVHRYDVAAEMLVGFKAASIRVYTNQQLSKNLATSESIGVSKTEATNTTTNASGLTERFLEAIKQSDVIVLKELIQKGVDINQLYQYIMNGVSIETMPLNIAIDVESLASVQVLLQAGARYKKTETNNVNVWTAVHAAIDKHNVELVTTLINFGECIHISNEYGGSTALARAIESGQESMVAALLAVKVHADQLDNCFGSDKDIPLIQAIKKGRNTIVQMLLEAGASAQVLNSDGQTPLYVAVKLEDTVSVRALVASGADLSVRYHGDTLIYTATSGKSIPMIQILGELGMNMNAKDKNERTPLRLACSQNDVSIVRALLDAGADIERPSDNGSRPLMVAAAYGKPDVLKLLLERGAHVSHTDNDGCTALHWAVESGHKNHIQLLLEAGSDIEAKTHDGETPLASVITIADKHVYATAKLLIQKTANVNCLTAKGDSLLHACIRKKNLKLLQLLIANQADVSKLNKSRPNNCRHEKTPLELAVNLNQPEYVQALAAAGADIECVGISGETVLMKAVQSNSPEMIETLLKLGANPFLKNSRGHNVLHVLAYKSYDQHEHVYPKPTKLVLLADSDNESDTDMSEVNLDTAYQNAFEAHERIVHLLLNWKPSNLADHECDISEMNQTFLENNRLEYIRYVNARDVLGNTPLHLASERNLHGMVKQLLAAGANMHIKNNDSLCSISAARRMRNDAIIQILEKAEAQPQKLVQGVEAMHISAEDILYSSIIQEDLKASTMDTSS